MFEVEKKIIVDLIPSTNGNRPGYKMEPEYITVHDTGNTSKGANAYMHSRYIKNPTTGASWHFTVDDEKIYQHLPTNENGWHAGDGRNGTGNRKSIGIEICMNSDIDRAKAENLAAQLITYLMWKFDIPVQKVVQHNHWTGKNCPSVIRSRKNGWQSFIKLIQESNTTLTSIMGNMEAKLAQMVTFALKGNKSPALPYCSTEELAQIFIEEAEIEGVRADVAWAQTLKETGYFKYGGIVVPEQNNYSGIGALNGNGKGQAARFDSPRLGVRAQIQHLKAYASTEPLKHECIDPRFSLVKRGSAKYVEWLGYKNNPNGAGWAYPGDGYGYDIVKLVNLIVKEPVNEAHWGDKYIQKMKELGLISGEHKALDELTWAEFGAVTVKLLDMLAKQ
ncbi:N-acetylmuramoyl-L-alanine amidase [Anaerovorax sp. IOR16]|uniref:N-acetylmuramoyl-L-alanine amidase n=1 Tax=Anaerovorax sp. IOR16 TaxID=2773458 RepID=UPI001FD71056|nr:N-acetylmuramoyl-L-alanine amidase [Anaerovorax sp. IOR16]